MRLQSKLLAAFGGMAAVILAVSVLGYLEVRRLGTALYEIGVVRLPSIQGLERINEAKTVLADSLDTLISAEERPDLVPTELERQRRAWTRAREGWDLYEPLPQSAEETVLWKQFVAAWTQWKEAYDDLARTAAQGHATKDRTLILSARTRGEAVSSGALAAVTDLLNRLIALNSEIVAEERRRSIASYADMIRIQRLMIGAAGVGMIGAILLGVGVGRRLSRPMAEAARTLSRIAQGDFAARLRVASHDEVGEMATAMNSMAESLRDSKAKITEIVNHTTDALFTVTVGEDGRLRYESFNPAAAAAAGLSEREVCGREIHEIYPPPIAAQLVRNYDRCIAAGGPIGYEEEIAFAPGRRIFNTLLVPVKDEQGRVIRIAGFARDVTERRRAERARQTLEAQLRQAQKLEAVGQLAAGVAHDFNNILAAIILHIDIVRSQAEIPERMRNDLAELAEGAKRGVNLTRQLLLFSRKAVMRADLVDLNALITNFLGLLQRLIGEHIRIEFVAAPTPPLVLADAGMIEQVVMNLVVNARDAMPTGGRVSLAIDEVDIEESRVRNERASAGRYVRVRVADTGGGMAPEIMERIFEPFFTTKGPDKGTGLGLPTVFGIAQEHGGWVEVESTVGKGSTFSIFLPAQRGQVSSPRPGLLAHDAAVTGRERILVAEDNRSVRVATATILRNHGYQVFEAPDEAAAKSILEQAELSIDLLVADVALPGATPGQHLATYLHRHEHRPKVILMSGYAAEVSVLGDLGAYTYLPKPFDAARLLRVVRECLDGAE